LTSGIVWAAYLVSAILFILSLSGLSHQESARRGNVFGIAGMALAIGATILHNTLENYPLVIGMMLLGGTIGVMVSMRVQMTAVPQLVALLHSLVGLAAVMIGVANQLDSDPMEAFAGVEHTIHLVEIYLGVLIGAVTFSGSVIAFGKLQGIINWARLPIVWLPVSNGRYSGSRNPPTAGNDRSSACVRSAYGDGHRWRGHARGDINAEQLFWLGRRCNGLHAVQ